MDKRVTALDVADRVQAAGQVYLGGSPFGRKPLWLVRELIRRGAKGLHVLVGLGGLDVEALIGAGAVGRLSYSYVGLEYLGLAPWFRRARQQRLLSFDEWSERSMLAAFTAASERLPFHPSRSGLGSDLLQCHPEWQLFTAPYTGETLVAIPALAPLCAVVHVPLACSDGSALITGDLYADPTAVRAAQEVFISAERVLAPQEFYNLADRQGMAVTILGLDVTAVVEAPGGAAPGSCFPLYGVDLPAVERLIDAGRRGAPPNEEWFA